MVVEFEIPADVPWVAEEEGAAEEERCAVAALQQAAVEEAGWVSPGISAQRRKPWKMN